MDSEAHAKEYLSTVGELNPLKVLERFDSDTVMLIVIAIWTRGSMTGLLEEKGDWIRSLWQEVLNRMPNIQGCRLLWNSVFFVAPYQDPLRIKKALQEVLTSLYSPELKSFCVLFEANGSAANKLSLLDDMQSEIASTLGCPPNFSYVLYDGKDLDT